MNMATIEELRTINKRIRHPDVEYGDHRAWAYQLFSNIIYFLDLVNIHEKGKDTKKMRENISIVYKKLHHYLECKDEE